MSIIDAGTDIFYTEIYTSILVIEMHDLQWTSFTLAALCRVYHRIDFQQEWGVWRFTNMMSYYGYCGYFFRRIILRFIYKLWWSTIGCPYINYSEED